MNNCTQSFETAAGLPPSDNCVRNSVKATGAAHLDYERYPHDPFVPSQYLDVPKICGTNSLPLDSVALCVTALNPYSMLQHNGNWICNDPMTTSPGWYQLHQQEIHQTCCDMVYSGGYAGGTRGGAPCQKVLCLPGGEPGCYATMEACQANVEH